MAYKFYAKQSNANLATFLPKMAQFLNNSLMGFTGPTWLVVEAYSQNAAVPHQNPAAGDIGNLSADNSWRGGSSMTVNDYIIFQSASDSNKFQVGFNYGAASTMNIIVAPREGFNTGFGTGTMSDNANWTLPKLTQVNTDSLTNGIYNIVADADHFNCFYDDGANRRLNLLGKLTNINTSDATTCAVIYNQPSQVYGQATGSGITARQWYKLSATDQSSQILIYGNVMGGQTGGGDGFTTASSWLQDAASGEFRLLPLGMNDINDGGFFGWFGVYPDIYMTWSGVNGLGTFTMGNKTYVGIGNGAGQSPVIMPWDGMTAMP